LFFARKLDDPLDEQFMEGIVADHKPAVLCDGFRDVDFFLIGSFLPQVE
jgi:hypothetical protein